MSRFKGFSEVQLTHPKRSAFDKSHRSRSTTRMGRLTPILIEETLPSDTFHLSSEVLLRLAPLLAPIYDDIRLFVHFFFVPNRLLWEEWETFITAGRLGEDVDAAAPIPPRAEIAGLLDGDADIFSTSSLADYLGVPILPTSGAVSADYSGIYIDMLPFLAYQRCWFDYYRDRNFVPDDFFPDEFPVPSGTMVNADALEYMALRTRNYLHDYFTSALPFTQRGAQVLMPFDAVVNYRDGLEGTIIRQSATGAPVVGADLADFSTQNGTPPPAQGTLLSGTPSTVYVDNIESITSGSVTINDFRSAFALQVWYERNAVGGSRYTESTEAHFGVKPQDSRLQRAEFIGGGLIEVKISEVVSTAYSQDADDATVPLANMAGHGVTYGNTNQAHYFCPEHGFIIGIVSIMSPPSYHQGMPRMFRRRSFLDYPWPTFAALGEQQIDKAELFASPANLTEDADGNLPLFGYTSRYADWKYTADNNKGDFHDTLLFWTLTRNFGDSPTLGEEFNLFDDSVQDRIFAVSAGNPDNFWMYINNQVHVRRPLPYFGKPNTLGF